jgi:hypothetical protein
MSDTPISTRDYKYSDGLWAEPVAETFQLVDEKRTDYTVLGGYILRQVEAEYAYYDRLAPASPTPENPPPYYFPDGTYRVDPAYTLQLTAQKTTSYTATGTNNLSVTTSVFDPTTGQYNTVTTTISGNAPRATTVNSSFSTLVQEPQAGTLIDDCIEGHYVPGKVGLSIEWAESQAEMSTAIRRQMQRDSAIVRRVKCATNPLMRIGQTIKLVVPKREIAARHVLVGKRSTRNLETGANDMQLTLEFWTR